jgi:uncharacterized membrane-anchored protein
MPASRHMTFRTDTAGSDAALAPSQSRQALSKLPEITLYFWIMKILCTTLGETGGDELAQTLKIGYLVSSVILVGFFLVSVIAQLKIDRLLPAIYWTVILATSMAGTTMSDYMNRSAGLGYARGAVVLITLLLIVFAAWKLSRHTFDVTQIRSFGGEMLYWTAILISNTLGTSLGDFLSDPTGGNLGYAGSAGLIFAALAVMLAAKYFTPISNTLLFWIAFVLTRPLGATVGDLFTKPIAKGGLNLGTAAASAVLIVLLALLIAYTTRKERRRKKAELAAAGGNEAATLIV